ncbi:ABC transporter permease [Undibacter mobilis]|uniref:ABC transporter permease n=1 Tax=Undibacter mobilis TaxID=2292256 RepID=A0A371B6N3_9BRAD|nr:ABC transporter permease [Undibacter mobilis]RDV03238.1 ABC transporter permease [Undibacter mobilis]
MSTLGGYRSWQQRVGMVALWMLTVAVLLFLIVPLIVIIPLSFSSSAFLNYPIPSFSLRWYDEFFTSAEWIGAVKNTLIVGSLTAILATSLGTMAALGLNRNDLPFKKLMSLFFIAPLVVPIIVVAVGTYFFFAPLRLTGTFTGIILAHTAMAVPFVVITVGATVAGLDENLVRAGASLGAHPLRVFFKITLPIVWPGVLTGAVIAFATSLDEVVMILFLGGPEQNTVPRQMFNGLKYYLSPTITAAATVLILVSVLILALVGWLRQRVKRLQVREETA